LSKFLLGVACGYVFHNAIDRVVNMATTTIDKKAAETEKKQEDTPPTNPNFPSGGVS
jgi:hypothetical protein